MRTRKFGQIDWDASVLGFGCMRLPTVDGNPLSGNIDEKQAIDMIRYAIDQGVNYIDTAYPYHNGKSEIVVGKALQKGYRQKVKVATKSPIWLLKEEGDFDRYLDEQLEKLQCKEIDFYVLHSLSRKTWRNVVLKLNLIKKAEAAKKDGRIKHLGFSFHDGYEAFQEIVDGYDHWDFCQIQYNYMDIDNQAGLKGLQYAAAKGLAVVVMEPLLGGKLANPPAGIGDAFRALNKAASPAQWALQWVWNQPEVTLLLSGMSSLEQVKENLTAADESGVQTLSPEVLSVIDDVRERFYERIAIPCTECHYCMPCPQGVDIPRNFKLFNDGWMYSDPKSSRIGYNLFMGEKNKAGNCIQCKACEEKCPQNIMISQWMPKVHSVLGEGEDYSL